MIKMIWREEEKGTFLDMFATRRKEPFEKNTKDTREKND